MTMISKRQLAANIAVGALLLVFTYFVAYWARESGPPAVGKSFEWFYPDALIMVVAFILVTELVVRGYDFVFGD